MQDTGIWGLFFRRRLRVKPRASAQHRTPWSCAGTRQLVENHEFAGKNNIDTSTSKLQGCWVEAGTLRLGPRVPKS